MCILRVNLFKTGITFAVLSLVGKIPVEKDRFISCESGSEISCLRSCKILTGMLKGPLPLFAAREEIQDMISVLSTGEIKKELLQGCPKTFL